MRYPAFVHWAGFLLPDFTEYEKRAAGSEQDMRLREEIEDYTQIRIGSSQDIFLLICHAISESLAENTKVLNGTIKADFIQKCKNATEFLDIIKNTSDKYSESITFRPFLGIDTNKENNLSLATMVLDSGLFAGIELYGERYAEMPEKFLSIFNTARKKGIETRLSCLGFRNMKNFDDVFDLVQLLCPSCFLNPNTAVGRDYLGVYKDGKVSQETIAFVKDNNIRLEFSPAPTLSAHNAEQKAFAIRQALDNDIPLSLCTEDMLFMNKSISSFAADLCNLGVFSQEEVVQIISN